MATFTFIIALLFSSLQSETNDYYTGDENTTTYSDASVSERGDFVGGTDILPKP